MLPSPSQPAPQADGASRGLTIAQLILSGLGLVISLLIAAGLLIYGLTDLLGSAPNRQSISVTFSLAAIFFLGALLTIPSLVYSVQHLSGKDTAKPFPKVSHFKLASIALILWLVTLALGSIISKNTQISWLLLPPFELLAIGLPVWWIFELACHGLSTGSPQRGWGIFNFGIFITTPMLMALEIVVLIGLVAVFAIWASQNGTVLQSLQNLSEQITRARGNPEAILPIVLPYLQNPVTIFGILALIAGLMPMIEELFKPLGLWVYAGNPLTPAQGFVGGAVSGAAFALVESLLYLSTPLGEGWAALAIGRAGTCLLHITASALVGRAMAEAWSKGAYLRLGATYLLAVALHGLWNSLSILSSVASVLKPITPDLRFLMFVSQATPYAITILLALLFGLLWSSHRSLIRENKPDEVNPANLPEVF